MLMVTRTLRRSLQFVKKCSQTVCYYKLVNVPRLSAAPSLFKILLMCYCDIITCWLKKIHLYLIFDHLIHLWACVGVEFKISIYLHGG